MISHRICLSLLLKQTKSIIDGCGDDAGSPSHPKSPCFGNWVTETMPEVLRIFTPQWQMCRLCPVLVFLRILRVYQCFVSFKSTQARSGVMAQQLWALTTPPKEPHSSPRTSTVAQVCTAPLLGNLIPTSPLLRYQAHIWGTDIHPGQAALIYMK